ncbi:hypothetical protein EV132_13234 [Rhizobium sullae]|uniref:Uncharacterized protein n=1 Tax=Rhizobium sullae TaxID=50338 RepID=A0A4R3PSY7_RHISU|nr:hypothetical protein EV132_13234 [Rhizobium sullae]
MAAELDAPLADVVADCASEASPELPGKVKTGAAVHVDEEIVPMTRRLLEFPESPSGPAKSALLTQARKINLFKAV